MALIDQYNYSQDTGTRNRIQMAMLTAATQISSEVNTTTNHTNRVNYAKLVINNPAAYTPIFAGLVATQNDPATSQPVALSPAVSDANLANIISAVWNSAAGVI